MCKLRAAVHPKEHVIGWFAVGDEHGEWDSTVQIHNFYRNAKDSKFVGNPQLNFHAPVCLQVDTQLRDTATPIGIKVLTSDFIPGSENALMHFFELPVVGSAALADAGGQEKAIMEMLGQAVGKAADTKEDVEVLL